MMAGSCSSIQLNHTRLPIWLVYTSIVTLSIINLYLLKYIIFGGGGAKTMPTNNDADAEVVFEYTARGCAIPKDVTIVRFHPSVVEVEDEAYKDCKQLREVLFDDGLRKIGGYAFSGCTSLSSITLPSTVTEIGDSAFQYCINLRVVVLNDGLQKIGRSAFYYCTSLSSITLPSTVTEVDELAFHDCSNLSKVVFNDGLQKIGKFAFWYCTSLESITLSSTVTEIGHGAFQECRELRKVIFNEGLQKIGKWALEYCTSLESITLPSTVTEIGDWAFRYCNNLRKVVLHGVPRGIGEDAFRRCRSLERFTFPTISSRLDNLIHTGNWEEIENEVNEVRGVVEWSNDELFVSTEAMGGGKNWNAVRKRLDKITRLIFCYELKEATSMLELALWKFKLDQVDKANPIPRKKCRMDAPGPVKDIILQYLR